MSDKITRRDFLKESGAGVAVIGVLSQKLGAKNAADLAHAPAVDRKRLIEALAETLIPTADGYPGYQHLEVHGITDEVLKGLQMLTPQDLNVFNAAAGELYSGTSFLDLNPEQRAEYLHLIVASFPAGTYNDPEPTKSSADLTSHVEQSALSTLQKVFRFTRNRVLITFYRNFPEDRIARDKNGLPVLPPGDLHQIIDPNTKQLVTGWDVANFPGPLSWEEEEARRAKWMKIRWEND